MIAVRLYGRPGCHLCEEAEQLLRKLTADGPEIALELVDIEADPSLHRAYLERIPVIEIDGEIVSELEPKVGALSARLDTVGT